MRTTAQKTSSQQDAAVISQLPGLDDQGFSPAAGANLIRGNKLGILRGATEDYPAWLDAIRSAKRRIHFEHYIIHSDDIGQQFAEALAAKASEGVLLRLIYDFGALGATSHRLWRHLRDAGVEVRCINPSRLDRPLSWLSRDHRKRLCPPSKRKPKTDRQ